MRKVLLYFACKYKGDYDKIYEAIKQKEPIDTNILAEYEKNLNCNYVTLIDANYPFRLKSIGKPPFVLFYHGDINLMSHSTIIAIIGARKNSVYGRKMTEKIVGGLKNSNVVVISGLAKGIDGIAHTSSLYNNVKTIAVLGSSINYVYPKENINIYNEIKQHGLLISEYPNTMPPEPKNFLIRNRIIAALSDYIVVVEAKLKSGTMNTVTYGLDYGKEICCVPYLASNDSGCNYLIKQGAKLVESANDIFE